MRKLWLKPFGKGLSERKIDLSHCNCLELVARQFGLADWNTLAAKIDRKPGAMPLRLPEGWIISG
jgi:hypothetical protein